MAILASEIWSRVDISEGQRQHKCRCPKSSQPIKARNNKDYFGAVWVHHITSEILATESQLDRVRVAIQTDWGLSWLKHQVFQGWPDAGKSIPESIHPFRNWRDQLLVGDGLIFKAHKLVIPASKKQEFLRDLHIGHLEEVKTLLRVWECMYCPDIMEDIKECIKRCEICLSMKPSQQKEPLIPHDVLHGPWEKVGIDIFQYRSHDYMLIEDYFRNFPLVRVLNNQMATHVIDILKMMFSQHGIPAWVFIDQGRQFTSAEFCEFAKCYRFEILYSTPRYQQSKGFIESMVKIMNQIMSRTHQAKEDAHIVMWAYRSHQEGSEDSVQLKQ